MALMESQGEELSREVTCPLPLMALHRNQVAVLLGLPAHPLCVLGVIVVDSGEDSLVMPGMPPWMSGSPSRHMPSLPKHCGRHGPLCKESSSSWERNWWLGNKAVWWPVRWVAPWKAVGRSCSMAGPLLQDSRPMWGAGCARERRRGEAAGRARMQVAFFVWQK